MSDERTPSSLLLWVALRACLVEATLHHIHLQRYDHHQYVDDLPVETIEPSSDLAEFAKWRYERADHRREAVDEKAKLLAGLITVLLPLSAGLSVKLAYPWTIMAALVPFATAGMLLLFYFLRVSIMTLPTVDAADASQPEQALRRRLIHDYLSSANRNEQATSFRTDVFRAAARAFVVGLLMVTALAPAAMH